jgi:hypothetical protein
MNRHRLHPDSRAARALPECTGMASLDSGLAPGLVVVDSNRPTIRAGAARH